MLGIGVVRSMTKGTWDRRARHCFTSVYYYFVFRKKTCANARNQQRLGLSLIGLGVFKLEPS